MYKRISVSLLSLAIASVLSGCGGSGNSDNTSNASEPSRTIKALDGTLKQAVVFNDANNNLRWDNEEALYGLTDDYGELKINASDSARIGIMTLIAGSELSNSLAKLDDTYQGVSSIDSDFPGEPVKHELTLVAPAGVNIISPYSHVISLVAMKEAIATDEATAAVSKQLEINGYPIDLLADYVAEQNAAQHKLAQITFDALAKSGSDYMQNWQGYIDESALALSQLNEEQLQDPYTRPVVDGDPDTPVMFNRQLVYNTQASSAMSELIRNIGDLSVGDSGTFLTLDLSAIPTSKGPVPLNVDPDMANRPVTYSLKHLHQPNQTQTLLLDSGLELSILEDGVTLVIASDRITRADKDYLTLNAHDHDQHGKRVGSVGRLMSFKTTSANVAPSVDTTQQQRMQTEISSAWLLTKGEEFEASINISDLFTDPEGDPLSYKIVSSLTELGLTLSVKDGMLSLSGTPVRAYNDDNTVHTLTILAGDQHNDQTAKATFTIPKVAVGVVSTTNPLVGKVWYYIDTTSNDDDQEVNVCRYVAFANGQVTQTLAGVYDYHGCTQASTSTISASSYSELNLNTLKEQIYFNSKWYTVRYEQNTDKGKAYGVTIDSAALNMADEVFVFYSDPSEVTKRLNVTNGTRFDYKLALDGEFINTNIEASLTSNQAAFSFHRQDKKRLTCEEINGYFYRKSIISLDDTWGYGVCKDSLNGEPTAPRLVFSLINNGDFSTENSCLVRAFTKHSADNPYKEPLKFNLKP